MLTKTILLVEDNCDVQEIEKLQLELLGFQVTTASDGVEALQIFQKHPERFSLVFTDLQMPHMNGDELAQHVHQINPQVPVLLATGSQEANTQDLLDLGIQAVMFKPYGSAQLIKEIDNLIPPL